MSAPTVTVPMVLRRAAEIAAHGVPATIAIPSAAGADPVRFAGLEAYKGMTPQEKVAAAAVLAVCRHLNLNLIIDCLCHPLEIAAFYQWRDGYGFPDKAPTDGEVLAALTETADALDQEAGV